MHVSLKSALVASLATVFCNSAFAQDDCATATPLAIGPNAGDTTSSTLSPEPWGCGFVNGADNWHTFSVALLSSVTVDTLGSVGIPDTVLELYDGTAGCGSLVSVACNDDAVGLLSSITALVPAGTYYVRVGGFGSAVGTYNVNLAITNSDECVGAAPVFAGANGLFDNTGATNSAPPSSCSSMNSDLWFVWVAECNANATIDTSGGGSLSDTVMEVWDACGGTVLACNDDGGVGLRSLISLPVVGGTSYYIRVGDFGSSVSQGTFPVNIALVPTASGANDECPCADPLLAGPNAVDTTGSTVSSPSWTCGLVTGGDRWYTYTVTGTCVDVTIDTFGSTVDTVLEVWDSCGGNVLGCNDDTGGLQSQVIVPTLGAGDLLVVRAGLFASATGAFTINVTEAPAPLAANDECAGAIPIFDGQNGPFNTDSCTVTTSLPAWGCALGGSDVWYTYTALCTAPHTFNTCGSNYDTAIELFDATGTIQIACDDDAGSDLPCAFTLQSSITGVPLTVGTTYCIRVGGFNGARGEHFVNVTTGTNQGTSSVTTVSGCPTPATLAVTGDFNIGGTIQIDVTGGTGLVFCGFGFGQATVPAPCGCDAITDGGVNLGDFVLTPSRLLNVPCDPFFVGLPVLIQGVDAFPTSGGCTFLGIPFGVTDIETVILG